MTKAVYILWALPIKKVATEHGWHSFRVQKDDFTAPDFTKGLK